MEFFRIRRDIPFMRHAVIFNVISILTFVAAVAFLAIRGLNFSIEFTGGTVMEVSYPKAADLESIRGKVGSLGYADAQIQNFGTSRDVMIRLPLKGGSGAAAAQQSDQVMAALKEADPGVQLRRVEFVGPQVGEELFTDGALALLVVVVGIMIYLAFRFEWKFSVAAIVANLHDVENGARIIAFFASGAV